MKKIVYLALCLGALASLDSCNPKAKATAVQTTKRYTEHIVGDDYNAFVRAIRFTETPANSLRKPAPVRKAAQVVRASNVQRRMSDARRSWNHEAANEARATIHPNVTRRAEVRDVQAVKQVAAPNAKADVVLKKSFRDGLAGDMTDKMASFDRDWKVRATDNKEVWRAKTARHSGRHDKETMKIRENRKRDFLKDNERGDRRFVKDITKRRGEKEIVKTLENGRRHRDVLKVMDGKKPLDEKAIGRRDREIIKAKDSYRGNRERFREVFVK